MGSGAARTLGIRSQFLRSRCCHVPRLQVGFFSGDPPSGRGGKETYNGNDGEPVIPPDLLDQPDASVDTQGDERDGDQSQSPGHAQYDGPAVSIAAGRRNRVFHVEYERACTFFRAVKVFLSSLRTLLSGI